MTVPQRLGRAVAVLLLVPAAALLAVRWVGPDLGHPWPALLTVLPWSLVPALVGSVAVALLRWRGGLVAAGLVVGLGLVTVAPRVVPGPTPDVAAQGPVVTVAVANLRIGSADAQAVVAAVRDHDVDVLVTLELTDPAIERLTAAGLDELLPNTSLEPSRMTSGGGIHSSLPLTPLAASEGRRFGRTPRATVTVDGVGEVRIDGVHPLPPINDRWVEDWRTALSALDDAAGDGTHILAGDFNATHDHGPFRDLLRAGWVDAADARGAGLRPTFHGLPWGEPVPPVTLDHVLVDTSTSVEEVTVLPLPGSDHRILVARLRLP